MITFLSKKELSVQLIMFILFSIGAILFGIQTAMTTGFQFEKTLPIISALILVGVFSFVGNFYQFRAITTAPNGGLAVAIVSLQSGLIAILAVVFFKQQLTFQQVLGMFVALSGIMMISLGSK